MPFKSGQSIFIQIKNPPKMDLMMNAQNMEEFKFRIKKKFPQLTEADLKHKEGKEERMLRNIAYKLRMTKHQIQSVILGF
jgi:hypothetical protein